MPCPPCSSDGTNPIRPRCADSRTAAGVGSPCGFSDWRGDPNLRRHDACLQLPSLMVWPASHSHNPLETLQPDRRSVDPSDERPELLRRLGCAPPTLASRLPQLPSAHQLADDEVVPYQQLSLWPRDGVHLRAPSVPRVANH
jgi:hypothetical protein